MTISMLAFPLALAACAGPEVKPGTPAEWRAKLQPPLAARDASALATSPTLHLALTLALQRSPVLQSAYQNWRAAIERVPQMESLPDPMLEASLEAPSLRNLGNAMGYKVGVSQTIPWPAKLRLAGRSAVTEAAVARLQYQADARDLLTNAKDAWNELYYLDQAIPVTREVEALLRREATLAYGQMNAGRATLSDAYRAESQAAQLGYDRQLLSDRRRSQAERLRSFLNLPPDAAIGPVRAAPVYPVELILERLQARAAAWNEALRMSGLETVRAAYEARLARLARLPDPTIGLTAMNTKSTAMGGGWTDSFEPMLSMNLPIWEQRNRALVAEKDAMRRAAGLDAMNQANLTRQAVAEAWYQARLTGRLVELYQRTLLPQAEAVMRQAEADWRAGAGEFSNVLEVTVAWHNFVLSSLRAEADHGQAIDALENALGATAQADGPNAPKSTAATAKETGASRK
jgi:outer membrane protein TolC